MNSRQQLILQTVIDKGRMSVSDLSKMTGVSEVTIRQDLNTLEKQSYLRRTHGFAVPLDSDDVETRMMNNYTVKRELADYAASLVSDGETIFIENGSWPVVLVSNVASLSLPLAAISHISLKMPCVTLFCWAVFIRRRVKASSAPLPGNTFSKCISARHLLALMAGCLIPVLPAEI